MARVDASDEGRIAGFLVQRIEEPPMTGAELGVERGGGDRVAETARGVDEAAAQVAEDFTEHGVGLWGSALDEVFPGQKETIGKARR